MLRSGLGMPTVTALPSASSIPDRIAVEPSEPVALLQLDARRLWPAAMAVYAEVRKGRSVVAVASGATDACRDLTEILDRIGMAANQVSPGSAMVDRGVSVVAGPVDGVALPSEPVAKPLRVALAGCGVVGGGVLEHLLEDPRFEIVGVLVRDGSKHQATPRLPHLLVSDPAALLAREPDVLIDALSDAATSLALIRAALARAVHVISASKQALAGNLDGLTALAEAHGVDLRYSASVGGGTPMLETVKRARDHGSVVRLEAILNGTCNFVLDQVEQGVPFDDALEIARAKGFAESDSSADLEGRDAAAKLQILAHVLGAGSLPKAEIARQTLTEASVTPGQRVRQIARLDLETMKAEVGLEDVTESRPAAEGNELCLTLQCGRVLKVRGRGAGRLPTTASVWADLLDVRETWLGRLPDD